MKIVAMLHQSVGNESVGSEWIETKIFDANDRIGEIIQWAYHRTNITSGAIRDTLSLQIAQEGIK